MPGRGRRAATFALECACVLALLFTASTTYVYIQSEHRLTHIYSKPSVRIEGPIENHPETLARGRHLAVHVGLCTWCHGGDLSGKQTADDPWVGRLHASNLTSGAGGIGDYTDLDLDRAVRHGIRPDGRSLLLMPSQYLAALTDDDLTAIIAWLRTAEPVDLVRSATHAGPLTRIALVTGLAPELISAEPIEREREPVEERTPNASESLGEYLVDIASCRVCHHDDLSGGLHPLALPDEPPPPDLTASGRLSGWSFDDFENAMRLGVTPDGHTLSPEYMPWTHYAGMTETELKAIWRYLKTR